MENSTFQARAARIRASVLDQLVSKLKAQLGEHAVLVFGGGYMGSRATRGSKHPPVLQVFLKKLSQHFRLVIVDEVGGEGRRVPRCVPPTGTNTLAAPAPYAHLASCGMSQVTCFSLVFPRPQYLTSKCCSACGTRMQPSSTRGFHCGECNITMNR